MAGYQGEAKQGKHLLSKALKRAHNTLGNHQLVSQAGPETQITDPKALLFLQHTHAMSGNTLGNHQLVSQAGSTTPITDP